MTRQIPVFPQAAVGAVAEHEDVLSCAELAAGFSAPALLASLNLNFAEHGL